MFFISRNFVVRRYIFTATRTTFFVNNFCFPPFFEWRKVFCYSPPPDIFSKSSIWKISFSNAILAILLTTHSTNFSFLFPIDVCGVLLFVHSKRRIFFNFSQILREMATRRRCCGRAFLKCKDLISFLPVNHHNCMWLFEVLGNYCAQMFLPQRAINCFLNT